MSQMSSLINVLLMYSDSCCAASKTTTKEQKSLLANDHRYSVPQSLTNATVKLVFGQFLHDHEPNYNLFA